MDLPGNNNFLTHFPYFLDFFPHYLNFFPFLSLPSLFGKKVQKKDFDEYEMRKELDWKAWPKWMKMQRVAAICEHETIKKHKDHPWVHHPGSKAKLEQVIN